MLKAGIINPCKGPWASPIVIVHKEGSKPRFCVDYRKLNDVTKKDAYPLPHIDDILDSMGPAKIFSTIDAASGYHQIPVHPEDQEKTCFTTWQGNFQWTTMPFGLCNAPASYQCIMDTLLQGALNEYALNYVDDTVIYSRRFEDHLKHLRDIFRRLQSIGLKLHTGKCHFGYDHVDLLGHHVSKDGTWVQKKQVEKVENLPNPKNVHEVRIGLGLFGYYRRFVEDFALVARPLNKLLKHNQAFEWTEDCQEAWDELKSILINPPVLARPDTNKPYILTTDGSRMGIGAVLSQISNR